MSLKKPKFCILVPAYNEENTIVDVIESLNESGYHYLIINDGSTDFTTMLARSYSKWTIGYPKNKGKGFAIKLGAEEIINKGYDYILVMDADGQTSLDDIPQFLTALKMRPGVKIIIGNRLYKPKNMPFIRLLTNKFMSWLISILIGIKIPDTQCGFRLLHRSVFNLLSKEDKFGYETEQLLQAGIKGLEIVSVPVKTIYFKNRKSKINPIKDTIKWIKVIWRFLWEE